MSMFLFAWNMPTKQRAGFRSKLRSMASQLKLSVSYVTNKTSSACGSEACPSGSVSSSAETYCASRLKCSARALASSTLRPTQQVFTSVGDEGFIVSLRLRHLCPTRAVNARPRMARRMILQQRCMILPIHSRNYFHSMLAELPAASCKKHQSD